MKTLISLSETFKYYFSFINTDFTSTLLRHKVDETADVERALKAGYDWICSAQDASDDGGVARAYSIIYNPYLKKRGWFPSYPETTGYIIPTILAYSERSKSDDGYKRAIRMANWECEIQLKNGAIQGGFIGQKKAPAVFNTGQVIFGWIQAFIVTGEEMYLNCAVKAGEFLKSYQDDDGAWRHNLSNFTTDKITFFSYNTRTAWALYLLSEQTGEKNYAKAAIKNIKFTLKHQKSNGFFENNCLTDPLKPLLHTIAYCIRGILEVGIIHRDGEYIEKARKAADQILLKMDFNGKIPGRFNPDWSGSVSWSCLTGQAQIAIIWGRLFQLTNKEDYRIGMAKANSFLMKKQFIKNKKKQLHGGIPGSDPIWGDYGKYQLLGWAVKFFMDSLMLEENIKQSENRGYEYIQNMHG